MTRDGELLLLEFLEDQLAVDQVIQSALAGVAHFFDEFFSRVIVAQRALAGADQLPYL